MKESTEDIVLIEQYLEGNLDDSDKQAFEDRLSKDDNLNELLDEYAVLIAGVKFSGRDHMMARFKDIEDEIAEDKKVVPMRPARNNTWYYVAAAVALLCAVFFLLRPTNQLNSSELALAYFEPYPATIGAASRSTEESQAQIDLAMQRYQSGQYDQSIDVLKNIEDGNPEVNQFYLANAYQANSEYLKAIDVYKELIENGEIFIEQASWNLALCYLSLDKKEEAIQLLKNTNFTIPTYSNKSKELITKLE